MQILPGDILFVWGSGPIDRLIEGVTDGPSHCAMFINEYTLCEAQAGRLVGECDLSFYLAGNVRLEVWTDPELTEQERQQMVECAKTLYGTPYDYLLIPLELLHYEFGLRLDWYHENKQRLCSSLISGIADHIGRRWADSPNCAPVELINFGTLQKKGGLPVRNSEQVS